MEDHLKNKNRLESEWEALCAYQAEPNATTIGQRDGNVKKNRASTVIACESHTNISTFSCFVYSCTVTIRVLLNICDVNEFFRIENIYIFFCLDDHCRITLKAENNQGNSNYINASPIVSPNYIYYFRKKSNKLLLKQHTTHIMQTMSKSG